MERRISIGRQKSLMEEIHDRGAIEPRSWLLQCGIRATTFPTDGVRSDDVGLRINITIDARSWPDRGAIVVPLKRI